MTFVRAMPCTICLPVWTASVQSKWSLVIFIHVHNKHSQELQPLRCPHTHTRTQRLKQLWFRALNSSPAQHQVFDPLNGFLCVLTVTEVKVGGVALHPSLVLSCSYTHTHTHTQTNAHTPVNNYCCEEKNCWCWCIFSCLLLGESHPWG